MTSTDSRTGEVGVLRRQTTWSTERVGGSGMAPRRRRVRSGTHERHHRFPSVLEALPEEGGRDLQDVSGFGPRQLHDLAEHVRSPVWTVEALKHRHAASDLDLVNQQRVHEVVRARRLDATFQVFGKAFEAQVQALHRTLLDVEV
jgi:hypothetical protein